MDAGATVIRGGTRVADALTRAELTQCAHRNRPWLFDGYVVVTLCAEEILYLPMTTEISSLPQLTPEGLPLALARRAAEATRLAKAAQALEERGKLVTSCTLAEAAHISLNTACARRMPRETGKIETAAALSVLQYTPYSTSDNTPATAESLCTERAACTPASVDPPAASSAPDGDPPVPTLPVVCLAASHQLLWHWSVGTWQCSACGT